MSKPTGSEKNIIDKVYCLKCGCRIKSFYSYCIFCGASTEDNPKCNPVDKVKDEALDNARKSIESIKQSRERIKKDEIGRSLDDLTGKADSVLNKIDSETDSEELSSGMKSLFNRHLPDLSETIEKYAKLQADYDNDEKMRDLEAQLIDGLKKYCKAFDSIMDIVYEDSLTDVSIDLKVLDGLVQKYL